MKKITTKGLRCQDYNYQRRYRNYRKLSEKGAQKRAAKNQRQWWANIKRLARLRRKGFYENLNLI